MAFCWSLTDVSEVFNSKNSSIFRLLLNISQSILVDWRLCVFFRGNSGQIITISPESSGSSWNVAVKTYGKNRLRIGPTARSTCAFGIIVASIIWAIKVTIKDSCMVLLPLSNFFPSPATYRLCLSYFSRDDVNHSNASPSRLTTTKLMPIPSVSPLKRFIKN